MKRFELTATALSDLTNVLDRLTPPQAAAVLPDVGAIEASRIRKKLVKKLKEANSVFLTEVEKTFKLKSEIVSRYQKEYQDRGDGMEAADEKDFGTKLTQKMRAETDVVDKASKANELAPVVTEVKLGDDDWKSLKTLLPATVAYWVGENGVSCADLMVDVADAIDAAEEV